MDTETWKTIPEFSNYQVSSFGRVRRRTPGPGTFVGRLLTPVFAGDYLKVTIADDSGLKRQRHVHTLVAITFLGEQPFGFDVNHKDTNKRNNRKENLEYNTRKQNMEHAALNGLTAKGVRHGAAKLTEKEVVKIKRCHRYSEAMRLSKKFGVSRRSVEDIWYGRTWKHIP